MDKLKEYIQLNKEHIDDKEPRRDLWEGIAAQLNKEDSTETKMFHISWKPWAIAASVLLVFATGFLSGLWNAKDTTKKPIVSLVEVSPELGEAEHFYVNSIQNKLASFTQEDFHLLQLEPPVIEELKLKNDTYKYLYQTLNENPKNERVASSIILYYQSKLDLLNNLEIQLASIKSPSNESKINQ